MPTAITINNIEYPIQTDFRYWIEFQQLISAKTTETERSEKLLEFINEMGLPLIKESIEAILCFFAGATRENTEAGGSNKPVFDFEQDSEYIYSAFLTQYNIDLTTAKMHWWKFKSLFKSLSNDLEFGKIMMYRSINIKDVPKEHKSFYQQMKQRYALHTNKQMTSIEYAQYMKDYIDKRYKEAGLSK